MYHPHVSSDPITVRAAAALTTSFVESSAFRAQDWNQLVLLCTFTLGSATDARIQVEVASPAGDSAPVAADWHPVTYLDSSAAAVSGSTVSVPIRRLEYVLSATDTYAIPLPLNYKWYRIRVKATSSGTGTSLTVLATTGLA